MMEKDVCLRCGHKWYRRKPEVPKWCPECNSPYWNKERTRIVKKRDYGKKSVWEIDKKRDKS